MSDENSATLLEDSGEREGAGRRPELTSEEEEERVEELGLQLSEAADRFTDNYEGKCVHKPNSAQVTVNLKSYHKPKPSKEKAQQHLESQA